ncbi:hypothetical protein [Rhodococcus sp. H-CA8f]|uniref:hypothetical protein n=1 Tax=Rhodococcus sp. H-CA8f TaxID=1727214 RepID=UPI0012FFB4AA|nr:hypothetical protein [Rhodococcus sp. H-CA8f]
MMMLMITCDGGCLTHMETPTEHGDKCSDIDRELELGWIHQGETDYCPNCAKKLAR